MQLLNKVVWEALFEAALTINKWVSSALSIGQNLKSKTPYIQQVAGNHF
jgi:hypothetical protein